MNPRYTLVFLFVLLCNFANAQYCPPNVDFETGGTGNWEYFKGKVSTGPIYTFTSTPAVPGLHTITSGTDTDYYGGFPIVGNGIYSLMLGHDTPTYNADRARYNIHIPMGGSIYNLIYHYAVVLEDGGHTAPEQPRMEIRAFDSATGVLIACDSLCFVASTKLYGFIKSSHYHTISDSVYYRPWTAGNMNFQGLGGRTVTVDFTISGCSPGAHFGYGYIDMGCGLFSTKTIACATPTITLNGPAGYLSYYWCDSATFGAPIDTTQNITIPTPAVRTKYALIVTPAPGYGCVDTLFTEIIPRIPCSGAPAPGYASITRTSFCGDPDILKVSDYSLVCGLAFQWQVSIDNTTWTDIAGATNEEYTFYYPYKSRYYRCVVTCIASGLSTASASVFAPYAPSPALYSVINPPDSVCHGANYYVSTCGASTTYNVTTWYGDGTSDNTPLTTTGVRHADIFHSYAFPGRYSVAQMLYDGSLPVDSITFSHNYLYCSTLPVKFFFDNNSDCIIDSGETYLYTPYKTVVDSNGIPIDTISATSGFYYTARGGPGTIYGFRLLIPDKSVVVACPATGVIYDTIQAFVNHYSVKYFGLNCTIGSHDFVVHAIIPVTGARDQWGDVFVHDKGNCGMSSAAEINLSYSPKYDASIDTRTKETSVTGNTITWALPDLSSKPVDLWYAVWAKSGVKIGDTVQTYVSIGPMSGDFDSSDNVEIIIDTVSASCDPNFISVTPAHCLPLINASTLRYTIHFENTGNDTAFNVYVMDTLSDNVDPRTLEVVDASAQMDIAMINTDGHTVVKFDFPGINLLDSSHHGECDGMVMFNVKTRPGLPEGASILNHAGIFFDINPAVLTNTVENIVGCASLSVMDVPIGHNVSLFPNPAKDELLIKMDKDAFQSYTITNQLGQVLMQHDIVATQTKVNIKMLPPGVYYVNFRGASGSAVQKFVKM